MLALRLLSLLGLVALAAPTRAGTGPWVPDLGDGRYRNPIIHADYSDPDVVRVGDDYWMTASSFSSVPALPILHSRDLVNRRIVGHAVQRLPADFDLPQHGNGVWAPSIRHHAGRFYIYWGDPDRGVYMVRARDPRGPWSEPALVKAAKGWIDPTPLWDDDGNAYLVHAFAGSRAGIKSVLDVARLSWDGTRVLDEGTRVFDGRDHHPTIEGPKFYERGGWYYIFAPAGGVPTGWQTVLRARSVLGPYEDRIVMDQGSSPVNGPHQGGWVSARGGEEWFVHFQDRGAYGRIVHLQPMTWRDGWPVIGEDPDGDGRGQPVLERRKPNVGRAYPAAVPQTSDEFDDGRLGLAWQWNANPRAEWSSLAARRGRLRLAAQPLPAGGTSLWAAPNLLLQKLPAPSFTATTRVTPHAGAEGETAGLVVYGMDYAYVGVRRTGAGYALVQARALKANEGGREQAAPAIPLRDGAVYLRVTVREREGGAAVTAQGGAGGEAICQFAYGTDGTRFTDVGDPFPARAGRWVGARVGLFALAADSGASRGYADFDWFRVR